MMSTPVPVEVLGVKKPVSKNPMQPLRPVSSHSHTSYSLTQVDRDCKQHGTTQVPANFVHQKSSGLQVDLVHSAISIITNVHCVSRPQPATRSSSPTRPRPQPIPNPSPLTLPNPTPTLHIHIHIHHHRQQHQQQQQMLAAGKGFGSSITHLLGSTAEILSPQPTNLHTTKNHRPANLTLKAVTQANLVHEILSGVRHIHHHPSCIRTLCTNYSDQASHSAIIQTSTTSPGPPMPLPFQLLRPIVTPAPHRNPRA